MTNSIKYVKIHNIIFIKRSDWVENVKRTLLLCVSSFAVVTITVSALLYTLSHAPFGANEKTSIDTTFNSYINQISPLPVVEGADADIALSLTIDVPASVPSNTLSYFPPIDKVAQKADYAAYLSIDNNKDSQSDSFIYYCQVWAEYADLPYGNQTIGSYGCGPTNVAMVVSTLTGKRVTPDQVADLAVKWGLFVPGVGTSHAIFSKSAKHYGVKLEEFSATKSGIINKLKAGRLIICSMGNGYFSRSGHFITLRGITPEGKILIADSYSPENTQKEWDIDFLMSQLRYSNMWAFYE